MAQVAKTTGNVEVLRQAYEEFSRNNLDAVAEKVAGDIMYTVHPRNEVRRNREEFIERLRWLKGSYSDGRLEEVNYIDAGEAVVAVSRFRGTNDGPIDDLPATGKEIDLPACEVVHFNGEGQIVSGEIFFDLMTLLVQLGHVDPPQKG